MNEVIDDREGIKPGAKYYEWERKGVMIAAGYEIIKGPIERFDGQRAFYVYDPEGNRLEFATKSGLKPSNRVADEMGFTTDGDA